MAKVYSDEVKEVVYKKKRMIEGVRCDICGKIIKPRTNGWNADISSNKYFKVMTGHNDWGTDSCDSIEHNDICPDCIDKFVSDYLKTCNGTNYLELETKRVYRDMYEWWGDEYGCN